MKHAGQNHDRDEVRRVDDGLHRALELLIGHLIEHQGQNDRQREGEDQRLKREQERVDDQTAEVVGIEELHEVLHQRLGPRAAHDAKASLEILEGDLYAVHRDVLEDEDDHEHGNQQQIEFPVIHDAAPEPAACRRLSGLRRGLHPITPFIF